ncbi:hypothetical protein GCM10007857_80410 [Bradyrhizobium iriomotense]|uniref:Uncharacterized protein n=1 Tax=Bradyrhizobium iriomotense TaxID=441950 RepID=A0ABQ6BD39_9BRAD|nr:hypothetical protein GCM10007857_80410 [Bradyrhizobium iriomotense]
MNGIGFRRALLTTLCLMVLSGGVDARTRTPRTGFTLDCDTTLKVCKTGIIEVHADDFHLPPTTAEWVFKPPVGVTLDDGKKGGVELEAGGAEHYVTALGAGPSWLKCKWFARKKPGGDNGLAKGYCWASMK